VPLGESQNKPSAFEKLAAFQKHVCILPGNELLVNREDKAPIDEGDGGFFMPEYCYGVTTNNLEATPRRQPETVVKGERGEGLALYW